MIFKRLVLKNFMSYANAEIDFSGLHTACLSGPNGAGKSSLLDAITWVLWEEGRARSDELIKIGTNEMSCELEFFMEGELYRSYRSRIKGLKGSPGKSNLEFQIFNSKEKTWHSLTRSTVRQTQELIENTIRMDHTSFINSVYLKQGKADEFTTKRPSERKQILSDILGLQVYDELCILASSKIKEIERDIEIEQNLVSNLNEKVLRESEFIERKSIVETELSCKQKEVNDVKNLLSIKESLLKEREEKDRQTLLLEKSRQDQLSLVQALELQYKSTNEKAGKLKEIIEKKEEIKKNYKNYIQLRSKIEDLTCAREEVSKLNEQKVRLGHELEIKINDVEHKLELYKSKIFEKQSLKNTLKEKLKSEDTFINDFLPKAQDNIKSFYHLQQDLLEIETSGHELTNERKILESKLDLINGKKTQIEENIKIVKNHTSNEPCPLCKGPIKDKEKVIRAYEKELALALEDENKLLQKIKEIETKIKEEREKYVEVKRKLSDFTKGDVLKCINSLEEIKSERFDRSYLENLDPLKAVSFLESQLEVSKGEFQKIKEAIAVLDREVESYEIQATSLNSLLKSGEIVKEITNSILEIEKKIQHLNYDEKEYNSLKQKISEGEKIVVLYNSLLQAEEEIKILSQEVTDLSLKIEIGRRSLAELEDSIKQNKQASVDISSLRTDVEELKSKETSLTGLVYDIQKELIVILEGIKDIEKAKQIVVEKQTKIQSLQNDKKHFEILEHAFSKNGIQIAIIETVVPELEKEANRILSKLTDNQMHIALRTQREKKSTSGIVETLDVIIADDAGTRNYELYSGGEAFKIDFALRLALSRLLANRSGAKLRTLIIDEGFGSQDSEGRERLLEVIRHIENEFETVLVVTHLDELKEAFPVQIQVSKDENGSHVMLVD